MRTNVVNTPEKTEKIHRTTRTQRRLEQTCYNLGESHFLLGDHLLVGIRMCVHV